MEAFMEATAITLHPVPWDAPEAVALRAGQRAEIEERYGPDSEPGPASSGEDVVVFLVARAGGALRPLGAGVAELKRMYVVPEWRGRGVSVRILAGLERQAVERGWRTLRLETGPKQPEAVRFYERSGYVRVPNYGHYAGHGDSLCYELIL